MSVILMYHRVAAPEHDPYGLAVHPDRFAAQVERLVRSGRVVPLEDLEVDRAPGQLAVTFDDGYADNATVAAPLLVSAGLPATWFITAGRLGNRRFWWDRLAGALLGADAPPSGDVSVAGTDLWLDLHTPEARRTALRFLHRRLRPLPPDELENTVDHVLERLGVPERDEDDATMTTDQLRTLADSPLQQIGAHTRTHLQLRGQSERLQREEVVGSVQDLSTLLDRPVRTFAYPFGSEGAVGDLAPRLVAEAGCTLACGTNPGAVDRRSDRFLLPRLNVRDWAADEFDARLDAVLARR